LGYRPDGDGTIGSRHRLRASGSINSHPTQASCGHPGRLSGDMRKHTLVRLVKGEHAKGKHPVRQCRVCASHMKRSATACISKFCVMPLHKGECFQKYHTLRHF
jgi:hypothetical protein